MLRNKIERALRCAACLTVLTSSSLLWAQDADVTGVGNESPLYRGEQLLQTGSYAAAAEML